MAHIEKNHCGYYSVVHRSNGRKYKRSLKTRDRRDAEGILCRFEDTLSLVHRGRLEVPDDCEDLMAFLLSDGKINEQPKVRVSINLGHVCQLYQHGRHFRIDDTIFNVGSSAHDAGRHPTSIDPGDSSQAGHQILDEFITQGTKII